jgi:hypothetical protein
MKHRYLIEPDNDSGEILTEFECDVGLPHLAPGNELTLETDSHSMITSEYLEVTRVWSMIVRLGSEFQRNDVHVYVQKRTRRPR